MLSCVQLSAIYRPTLIISELPSRLDSCHYETDVDLSVSYISKGHCRVAKHLLSILPKDRPACKTVECIQIHFYDQ